MNHIDTMKQEPVARSKAYDMIDRFLQNNLNSDEDYAEYSKSLDIIYTSPPAQRKPWVGLTPEQRATIAEANNMLVDDDLFDAIEAKLKEKNA